MDGVDYYPSSLENGENDEAKSISELLLQISA